MKISWQQPKPCAALVLLLFIVAFIFRTAGLSHDLHLGAIYHPDTPKQIRAVQQFLRGDYLVRHDHPDYDGYPFFNSHLVALWVRAALAVRTGIQHHVGSWTEPVESPTLHQLYWITRTWNALLSALAVALVYLIGRRFGEAVGWAAALLLLVSPLDFTGAHYASNDTTAAFFALAALWFGFRIAEHGRWRDLAGGAFCVGAAFSSKYHGGMSVLPVVIGCWLYNRNHYRFWSRKSISRWSALLLLGLLSVVVTSPQLIIYPSGAFKDILAFFAHTADFGLPLEFRELPLPLRVYEGWKINLPILINVVSIPVAVGFVLLIARVRRDSRYWLLLGVPMLHIVVGLAGKPNLHTVHHLPALPYIYLAAAVFFARAMPLANRRWRHAIAAVALCGTVWHLLPMARREAYFFRLNDTQWLARSWALDTTPAGAHWNLGRYTFHPVTEHDPATPFAFTVRSGSLDVVPADYAELFTLSLEDRPLTLFRNRDIRVWTPKPPPIQPPVVLPWHAPTPASQPMTLVPLDLPWIGRSLTSHIVQPEQPVRQLAMTTQPLERVWLAVHTGSTPARFRARFGGRTAARQLDAGQHALIELTAPRRTGPRAGGRHFYRFSAQAHWGRVHLHLITNPAQAGLWALQWGDHAPAATLLTDAAEHHLLYRAAWAIAEPANESIRKEKADALLALLAAPERWTETLGIAEHWLDALPYIIWNADDWRRAAPAPNVRQETLPDDASAWRSPPLLLAPGFYTLETDANTNGSWHLIDACGNLARHSDSNNSLLRIPPYPRTWRLQYIGPTPPQRVAIRPDTAATLQHWIDQLRAPPGARAAAAGADRDDPPMLARFASGITLHHAKFDVAGDPPENGYQLIGELDWSLPDGFSDPRHLAVWIHLNDPGGNTVAQGDHTLWAALTRTYPDSRLAACRRTIALPDGLKPGNYTIHGGLYRPAHRRRISVQYATVPYSRRHVVLGTVQITATEPPAVPTGNR